jgi:bifunctional DNA-binding transcriptional regulator/antitoxin component of YhaV-PrlF toxin-antitoxin module
MPRLVKGGKYVFGVSKIREDYQIYIPPEALDEYNLQNEEAVVLIAGSKTSGGFSINSIKKLKHSRLSVLLELLHYNNLTGNFETTRNDIFYIRNRIISWAKLSQDGSLHLSHKLAEHLNLNNCAMLIVARGSGNGPGFIAKGPIFDEALKHPELQVF